MKSKDSSGARGWGCGLGQGQTPFSELPLRGADGSCLPLESSHPLCRPVGPYAEDSGLILRKEGLVNDRPTGDVVPEIQGRRKTDRAGSGGLARLVALVSSSVVAHLVPKPGRAHTPLRVC